MSLIFAWAVIGLWGCFVYSEEIASFFKERFGKKQPIVAVTNEDTFEAATKAQLEEHKKQLALFDELLGIKPKTLGDMVDIRKFNPNNVRFDPVAESYIVRVAVNDWQSVNEFVKLSQVLDEILPEEDGADTAVRIATERRKKKEPVQESGTYRTREMSLVTYESFFDESAFVIKFVTGGNVKTERLPLSTIRKCRHPGESYAKTGMRLIEEIGVFKHMHFDTLADARMHMKKLSLDG